MSIPPTGPTSATSTSWDARARSVAGWLARYELIWLAAAAPLLLFPGWWASLGVALIGLTWFLRWVASGRVSRRTPLDGPIAVLLLMVGVSLAVSISPAWSWPRAPVIILGVATYYGLANSIRTENHLRWLAVGLVLAGLGYTLVGLLGTNWDMVRLVNLPQIYDRIPRPVRYAAPGPEINNALLNPRQVAGALVVLLPISLALLLFGCDRRLRLLSGLAALVMVGTLLLTQSIPGMIALGMASFFLALRRSRWFLGLIPLGLAALGGALLAYQPQPAAVALLSLNHPIGIAVALRLDMWSRALAMIHDMPFTGIGLNGFAVMQYQFYPGFALGHEPHAHNLYLQTALDLGVPGLIAFLWLLILFSNTVVKSYRSTTDRNLRVLLMGLAAGVLAHLTYGLMDITPWGSRTQVAFWAILGAATAVSLTTEQGNSLPMSSQRTIGSKKILILIVAGSLVALFILAAQGTLYVNLATIQAQQVLLKVRTTGAPDREALRSTERSLTRALRWQAGNAHLYSLLGEVYGWLGEDEPAIEAFRRRVELDDPDPIAYYAPSEGYLRRIRGEIGNDRWNDAIRVYRQWMNRFPERAEPYLLIAIVSCEHKKEPAQAAQVLEAGSTHAQPRGPLLLYSSQVQEGHCDTGLHSPSSILQFPLDNPAALYKTTGDYTMAGLLLKQALEIYRAALGEGDPYFATNLNNLGALYEAMGDYAAAEPLYRQATESFAFFWVRTTQTTPNA